MTERRSDRDLARRALRRAAAAEPPLGRLLARVPALLARAAREREAAADAAVLIWRAGNHWLPRLAGATALLVVLAVLWPSRGQERTSLEAWLLTGSGATQVSDPVLDAIVP